MISYHLVPISSQKGVLFFETPGTREHYINSILDILDRTARTCWDRCSL